jgi:hypothetical protein
MQRLVTGTSTDTLWDLTNKKAKIQIFDRKLRPNVYKWNVNRRYKVTNPDPMIIIESQTECIKFDATRKKSLISSQVLWRTNWGNKPHVFFYFHSMIFHYNECMLFITFSILRAHYKENETNIFRKLENR